MTVKRPDWIVKELAEMLGFDQSSITQLVVPDLETYTNETKLRAHLQDFLGPGPASKAFIYKYLAHQFPRLPIPEPQPVPGPVEPLFTQPPRPYASSISSEKPSQSSASTTSGPSFARQAPPHNPNVAVGVGRTYQKNRDADLSSFTGSIRQGAQGNGGGSGSGSTTPTGQSGRQQSMRNPGAITITEGRSKSTGGVSGSGSQKGKHRAVEKIWDAPKSKEVKKLEKLLDDLKIMQMGNGEVKKVDEGKECFCQARLHPLSPHTPQCAACGLIQCHLQPPDRACPSCARPLLTPSSLARLVQRVAIEIDAQIAKEEEARDVVKRAELAKAEAVASFPYLAGTAGAPQHPSATDAGHKVLTIGKGKGRITLTTTHTLPQQPMVPAEPERYSEAVIDRPRSPPLEQSRTEKELAKNLKWRAEEDRPWGDMKAVKKGEAWSYVEQQIFEIVEDDRIGRRKARKGKGTEGVNGRVVPGAAGVAS